MNTMSKSEYMKKWRMENKEHIEKYKKENKENRKKYYENNKESISEKGKIYRSKNKEALKIKRENYYLEHKEQAKLRAMEWDKNHPKEVKERVKRYADKNREIVRERQRLCKKNNPGNITFHVAKRRSMKMKATVTWINDFFVKEAYKLAKLREKLTKIKWHVDHVIPLKGKYVCGLHVHNNLQVIPAITNIKKSNHYSLGE